MHLAIETKSFNELFGKVNKNIGSFNKKQHHVLARYWNVILNTIKIKLLTYIIVRKVRKMRKSYNEMCEVSKRFFSEFIQNLKEIVEKEKTMLEEMKQINLPNFIIKMHEDIIADYEDLIEDFSIAIDDEIRDLVFRVSGNSLRQ